MAATSGGALATAPPDALSSPGDVEEGVPYGPPEQRIKSRTLGLRKMGRALENVGWASMAIAVVVGLSVALARDEQIYSDTGEVVRQPIDGLNAFFYLGFGALLILLAGRVATVLAEHVAHSAGVDLGS